MQEDGLIDLSNDGVGPTPLQQRAFYRSKSHWSEVEYEQAKQRQSSGGGANDPNTTTNTISWSKDEDSETDN